MYFRQGQFLNVRGEKTSEAAFYQAVCSAVQKSKVNLVDYCCTESVMVDKSKKGMLTLTHGSQEYNLGVNSCHLVIQSQKTYVSIFNSFTKPHSSVVSVKDLRTGGRWFNPWLGQYCLWRLIIIIATGFIQASLSCPLFLQWLCEEAANGLEVLDERSQRSHG